MKKKYLFLLIVLISARSFSQTGNALDFDGTNDKVTFTTGAGLPQGDSAYTLEAWIYPESMRDGGIIGWGTYGQTKKANAIRISGNGIMNYWWGADLVFTTGNITNAWHHVAATFDGTTRKLYFDGVQVASDTPGTGHNAPAANMTIGLTSSSEYFDGKIDDVRVYTTALSAAQIQSDMAGNIGSPGSLSVRYDFNSGTPYGNNAGVTTLTGLLTQRELFTMTRRNTMRVFAQTSAKLKPVLCMPHKALFMPKDS